MKQVYFNQRMAGLDILKIVSALIVSLFHMNIHFGFSTTIGAADKIIAVGANFMVMFFMLSGFSLGRKYISENWSDNTECLKIFYKKRFLKIYPSYLCFLAIILLFQMSFPATKKILAALIPIDLLGLQAHFPAAWNYLGNGGTWFISVLFFLYFIFPFLVKILHIFRRKRWLLFVTLYGLCILVGFSRIILGGDFSSYYASPFFRIPEFMIGMLISTITPPYTRQRQSWGIALLLGIIYCAGILLLFDNAAFQQNYLSYNIISIPIFGYVIFEMSHIDLHMLPQIFSRIISFAGELTFQFYLTQTFANRLVGNWITNHYFGISIDSNREIFIFSFSLNIIFAFALYSFVKYILQSLSRPRIYGTK